MVPEKRSSCSESLSLKRGIQSVSVKAFVTVVDINAFRMAARTYQRIYHVDQNPRIQWVEGSVVIFFPMVGSSTILLSPENRGWFSVRPVLFIRECSGNNLQVSTTDQTKRARKYV